MEQLEERRHKLERLGLDKKNLEEIKFNEKKQKQLTRVLKETEDEEQKKRFQVELDGVNANLLSNVQELAERESLEKARKLGRTATIIENMAAGSVGAIDAVKLADQQVLLEEMSRKKSQEAREYHEKKETTKQLIEEVRDAREEALGVNVSARKEKLENEVIMLENVITEAMISDLTKKRHEFR